MSSERQKFLEFAQTRTDFINSLIAKEGVSRNGHPLIRFLFPRVLCPIFISKVETKGIENLKEAQDSLVAQSPNQEPPRPLLMYFNHQSEADTYVVRHTLRKNGLNRLLQKLRYSAGLKMILRKSTRPFFASEKTLMVATPFDYDAIDDFTAQNPDLPESEKGIVDKCRKSYDSLNRVALKAMLTIRKNDEFVLGLYPESTRTRDKRGYIQRAPERVASYFKDARFRVIPIAMNGITHTFPVGENFKWRRSKVLFTVGEIYEASEVWNKNIQSNFQNPERTCMDLVMARIANLNPDIVSPEDALYYEALMSDNEQSGNIIQPIRWINKAASPKIAA